MKTAIIKKVKNQKDPSGRKNRFDDKVYIDFIKDFMKKKWAFYPSTERFFLTYHLDHRTFYNHIKNEDTTDKEPEETLNFWFQKLKEFQKSFCLDNVGKKNSVKGLIFILEKIHKVGEKKEELTNTSEIDFAIRTLENELKTFFTIARKPNIDFNKTFIILEGGRSGGKSENVGIATLLLCLKRTEKSTFICGREVQKSLETSVKSLLERLINKYKLDRLFKITNKDITCKHNQVKIIFMGLKEGTSDKADTVKSTDSAFGIWVEEAQTISQMSIDKLIPTTARNPNFKIFFTYNRQKQNTIIHDHFFLNPNNSTYDNWTMYGWDKTQHISIQYYDNKFNTAELEAIAEIDKKTNYRKWQHIWNGEPQLEYEGALWSYDTIKQLNKNINYEKENYIKRIVATDPATSSKEFNNEYGIMVLGITEDGIVHLIDDMSGHFTASEFGKAIIRAYVSYECEAVVYEENQGGEHIANTILSESKNIRLIPVRATQSKYLRALPIANLCSQGKINFIKSFIKLENQMLLLTTQGYQGATGESPDRLDAFVWGCYELLGLKEANTIETYFKLEYFKKLNLNVDTIQNDKDTKHIAIFNTIGSKLIVILLDYFKMKIGIQYEARICLKNIYTTEINKINNIDIGNTQRIITYNENLNFSNFNVNDIEYNKTDEIDKLKLVELANFSMTYIQDNYIYIENDNIHIENIIINNVCNYQPEITKENIILETLLKIIYNEFYN